MNDYDEKNVFNKILRKEIICNKVDEDNNNLSFEDISKQAPVHVLTIPKKKYKDFSIQFAWKVLLYIYIYICNIISDVKRNLPIIIICVDFWWQYFFIF